MNWVKSAARGVCASLGKQMQRKLIKTSFHLQIVQLGLQEPGLNESHH